MDDPSIQLIPNKWCVLTLICLLAILPLSNSKFTSTSQNKLKEGPNIIIVGAGASGIAAATRLIDSGFSKLRIFEAENRIGGRIKSIYKGCKAVDLGAHVILGESGNVVYDMVAPLGIIKETDEYYDQIGIFSDRTEIGDVYKTYDLGVNMLWNTTLLGSRNDTLREFVDESIKPNVIKNFNNPQKMDAVMNYIYSTNCESLKDLSSKGISTWKEIGGSQTLGWKGEGFYKLFDIMLKKHPNIKGKPINLDDKIFLNSEVTNIDLTGNGVIKVTTKNGSIYTADLVIVTVPLGVLKNSHKTLFQPPLPKIKALFIELMGVSTSDKIVLQFPYKWWPKDKGFDFFWTEKDKELRKGEFPWEKQFDSFYEEKGIPYNLVAWMDGENARMMGSIALEEVKKACMRTLNKFLGYNYTIPNPVDVLRSNWGTNPHFRGSGSYISMAAIARKLNASDFAEPITDSSGKEHGTSTITTHSQHLLNSLILEQQCWPRYIPLMTALHNSVSSNAKKLDCPCRIR